MPIILPPPEAEMFTDASKFGWGAHIDHLTASGRWTDEQALQHITGFVQVRENWKSQAGKIGEPFPVTRKSGNIGYSSTVRESQGIKKFMGRKSNSACNQLFFEAEQNEQK